MFGRLLRSLAGPHARHLRHKSFPLHTLDLLKECLYGPMTRTLPFVLIVFDPPPSRHHLSCDDCLEDQMENYQDGSVPCGLQQLYTMIRTHIRAMFLQLTVGLRLGLVIVHLFRFSILCFMFFCFLLNKHSSLITARCSRLSYTTQHITVLIVFRLILQTIIVAQRHLLQGSGMDLKDFNPEIK